MILTLRSLMSRCESQLNPLASRNSFSGSSSEDGFRQARFEGRNKPLRGGLQCVNGWSPEQKANRLQLDVQDDDSIGISHEAIY